MRCYAHYVQYQYTIRIRAHIAPYVMFCNDQLTFYVTRGAGAIEEMEKRGSELRIQRQLKSKVFCSVVVRYLPLFFLFFVRLALGTVEYKATIASTYRQ